jgi:hypothetical protein
MIWPRVEHTIRRSGLSVGPAGRSDVRIAKPMLLVTTPLGLIEGVYECYKLAGGLVVIMLAMLGVMFWAAASVVMVIRREGKAAEEIRCKS